MIIENQLQFIGETVDRLKYLNESLYKPVFFIDDNAQTKIDHLNVYNLQNFRKIKNNVKLYY